MSIQSEIVEAVRKRGYLEGWSKEQLAARQVMKLAEELRELLLIADGELSSDEYGDDVFERIKDAQDKIDYAGRAAKYAFDKGDCGTIISDDDAKKELFDIIVVCSILAYALGVDDMMQGALDKANADVKRGVR